MPITGTSPNIRVPSGGGEGPWWVGESGTITLDTVAGEYYILFGNLDSYSSTGNVIVTTLEGAYRVLVTESGSSTFTAVSEAILMLHKLAGTITVQ